MISILFSLLLFNIDQNRLANQLEELRQTGVNRLKRYRDAVDPVAFGKYELQWNYRVSCLVRAAKEGDLAQFLIAEEELISNRLNEKYDALPCNDKKFHNHQGPCNFCAAYRVIWQPFNPYFIQHEELPTGYFYAMKKSRRFEYLAVKNYIELEGLLLDYFHWSKVHPLILSYLRDTPKGDREYKAALNGKYNKIQCTGCQPKMRN